MASTRKDWEDLNITRDEVRNIAEALKNYEFRKLLAEYVEETQSPASRKKYQDDIIQLEAERGIDCTFVNPSPGFVVKTSIDGVKKAFINICANGMIGKPVSKPMSVDNSRGLSWSIPYSLTPGRDDYDNKKMSCVVYDVVFNPDTLHLSQNNINFRNLVIDTALKGLSDTYNVTLDKKNFKLPKLKYKGVPYATVIRKKSTNPPVDLKENLELFDSLKYPHNVVEKSAEVSPTPSKEDSTNYTTPLYSIKYRNDVDIQDYTDDLNSKIHAAFPKDLVIEICLPLLSSSKSVKLDILEKALELQSDNPAKYKLNITLPYEVMKDKGCANFDVDRKVLTVTLPVLRRPVQIPDIVREDSGVESDNGEPCIRNKPVVLFSENENEEKIEESKKDKNRNEFLGCDLHYIFPSFDYNRSDNTLCFIINVKNVDPNSVKRKKVESNGFHLKFSSVGSGFFPIHYAFYAKFNTDFTEDIKIETWDNNITIQVHLESLKKEDTIYVGLDEDNLEQRFVDNILDLSKKVEAMSVDENLPENTVTVVSASEESVVFNVDMSSVYNEEDTASCGDVTEESCSEDWSGVFPKMRTFSEGSGDDAPTVLRKSILKNRISRSLSESCADDSSHFPSGVLYTWSDSCIPECEEESKDVKKTVRFSKHIQEQTFRANSSILGQRRKNQKRARNKRKSQERRASESENSEDERCKWIKPKDNNKCDLQLQDGGQHAAILKKKGKKKQPKTPEFKSDLAFKLDK